MSARTAFPQAKLPDTHYFVTFSRGPSTRTFALRVAALYALLVAVPVLLVWLAGSTGYFLFHDELMASVLSRQAAAQYAYEDRISAMRTELERATSRQLLDQDALGGKLHDLSARQALLENRATMMASLVEIASGGRRETARAGEIEAVRASARTRTSAVPAVPAGASGFAPLEPRIAFPPLNGEKPRPDTFEPLQRADQGQHSSQADELPTRALDKLAISLDGIEFSQVKALSSLQSQVAGRIARLRNALGEAGLSADKLAAPIRSGVGGPFIPVKVNPDNSPFEREFASLQESLVSLEKLRRVMPYVPLRRPLPGNPDITSTFGVRMDPFFGRPALHSGIDFREEYGAPVHATAAGKIVTAGLQGGYGNMVEIDHGNGLATRYGHMSAILVAEGQWVEAGAVVGRLGSTGRSTGPHLHYETRIDEEAVDPARFLRAGKVLSGGD